MTDPERLWRGLPFTPLCALAGTVEHGKQLGRTLGFPTLNLRYGAGSALPANGVYAALCWFLPAGEEPPFLAVLNQGRHPTFPEGPPTVEAHLLGFAGDAYGRRVALCYGAFLRPERRFADGAALAAQLALDCAAARAWVRGALPGLPLAECPNA